jgi:cysteinyl-tRNA synthetase
MHLGNARPLCVFDVLRKYLIYRKFDVTFVQNFTDIDDKIIAKANKNGVSSKEISDLYKKEYQKDAHGLGVSDADICPTATSNIFNMIDFVFELIKKGYAYKTISNDVYFRTDKFPEYGKLSGQSIKDLQIGTRVAFNEEKENPYDFVLWKASKLNEPWWPSPWGNGRPGWHIECSAMIKNHLGSTIDMHCGGQDLVFPHHENEIAQSECCNGKKLANYWIHNGFVNINDEKMSKSLNNFFTVRDIAKKFGYKPIRYLMISAHYRTSINYSEAVLLNCKSALLRLHNCRENLNFKINSTDENVDYNNEDDKLKERLSEYKIDFIKAMDDDLNTADALAVVFDLTRKINSEFLSNKSKLFSKEILVFSRKLFDELCGVLGILGSKNDDRVLNSEVKKLIDEREEARRSRDFKKSDEIRQKLYEIGVILEDTNKGVNWKFRDLI